MAERYAMKPTANGHGSGAPGFDERRFLPEEVWAELRALFDPQRHFYGEFKLVIHDGRLVHTERLSRIRTLLSQDQTKNRD
jgi:hypothetical protein